MYVFEIIRNKPYNNAELREGDIIVAFENRPVATVDNLHKYLDEDAIGKKISLQVLRGGRSTEIQAVPAELN